MESTNLSRTNLKKFKFVKIDRYESYSLRNSLGNLLLISRRKNSSLQDFVTKRKDENGEFGYFNGSFSEIEIAENNTERFKKNILERGLKLLGFLEK